MIDMGLKPCIDCGEPTRKTSSSAVIQTDHGAEFGSQFQYHVLDRGIGHVYIKPATPRLNGKVERSHRIDQEEFYRINWQSDDLLTPLSRSENCLLR
jgi:transposase InsO family protein